MPLPSLTLGNFELVDPLGLVLNGSAAVMASGTSRGNPVPLEVAVQSWLQDGSIVATQGYDNREVTIRVRLGGPDLVAVAELEAALVDELGKPNTLTWDVGDGVSPPSVFTVVTSSMQIDDTFDSADIMEANHNLRTYILRLVCEAFVRSVAETVTPALAASGTTTTLVNNGTSTTGWGGAVSSGTLSGPTVVSGAVKVGTSAAVTGQVTVTATLTTAITTSSTKYLVVDWKPESSNGSPDLRAFADGVELTRSASQGLTTRFTRTWFGPVAASSIAVLRLESTSNLVSSVLYQPSGVRSLSVDNINRTDVKPSIGTARQLQRRITVDGSVRSPGNFSVQHETSSLGDVIAYVWPSGDPILDAYCPACRPTRTAGPSVTADATMVSGARETLAPATPTVFSIPASAVPPGDLFTAVARMRWTAASLSDATLTVSAITTIGGLQVGPTATLATRSYPATKPSTGWVNTALGRLQLPNIAVQDASTATVVVTLTSTVSGGVGASTLELDELWLFGSKGSLIMVPCGTGTPAPGGSANRLFVNAATVTTPRPTLSIGYAADGSDAHFPGNGVDSWEMPEFKPDAVNVLTVTSNALDAAVALRAAPRWHSHAAS